MNIISVKLLGTPSVKLNNELISFPYKKSEALFYYVVVNKKISREEAINMFWSESGEETGKKNLRDALYKIKTSTSENIFSNSKSVIEFSNDLTVESDTDNITEANAVNLYTGDFLLNFSVKNCYDFENWMQEKRDYYKEIYIKSIHNKINELISISDYSSIEKYGNILIKNDPYNEKTYRYLMKIHALSEDYNKAIRLYYELSNILKNDLDVEPEIKTKKLFKEILELKNTINSDHNGNYVNLKSKVENLTYYYTMYHETYPSLSSETINSLSSSNISDIESELKNIEKDLTVIDDLDTEYIKIKMEASYLAGRYYISIGEYEKGIKNIQISIRLAHKLDNLIYLLNNHKQMIFYAIQTGNNDIMNDYINRCLNLLEKRDIIDERGIILRLQGLYFIKTGNFKEADRVLNESINIFSSLNKFSSKYSVNISASYNYLGQMNKDLGNYEDAYDYFMKAINICMENSVVKGLEIFYSNAGQALYSMGRFKESEDLINKSIEYFDKFNVIWGRDFTEYYKALLEIKKGNYAEAQIHSKKAYNLAKKLNNPKSLCLIEKLI
ncbi:BTAD domain-containing putative transcriptional regulator [Sedimentibacter sp.]|uniref:BTAD domain-containing putative transcriptional regulator n=1 Tax=Sedimentibacter sp. TaxID=1960295 RepID=UPI0028A73D08|nr:BTAD domain-containing putative transcriptional regulator [Sedimentibacter sp.]